MGDPDLDELGTLPHGLVVVEEVEVAADQQPVGHELGVGVPELRPGGHVTTVGRSPDTRRGSDQLGGYRVGEDSVRTPSGSVSCGAGPVALPSSTFSSMRLPISSSTLRQ